jgi:hypothetical protein
MQQATQLLLDCCSQGDTRRGRNPDAVMMQQELLAVHQLTVQVSQFSSWTSLMNTSS